MIQDIAPKLFHHAYKDRQPQAKDRIIFFDKNYILLKKTVSGVSFLNREELDALKGNAHEYEYVYLFDIDYKSYFLLRLYGEFRREMYSSGRKRSHSKCDRSARARGFDSHHLRP